MDGKTEQANQPSSSSGGNSSGAVETAERNLLTKITDGVDLALVRQVAEGHLSDKALRLILTEESDWSLRTPPRLTISILNIVTNITTGSLPLRSEDKQFFVPRSAAIHRLLEEPHNKREFAAKSRVLRRDLELVRRASQLMVRATPDA